MMTCAHSAASMAAAPCRRAQASSISFALLLYITIVRLCVSSENGQSTVNQQSSTVAPLEESVYCGNKPKKKWSWKKKKVYIDGVRSFTTNHCCAVMGVKKKIVSIYGNSTTHASFSDNSGHCLNQDTFFREPFFSLSDQAILSLSNVSFVKNKGPYPKGFIYVHGSQLKLHNVDFKGNGLSIHISNNPLFPNQGVAFVGYFIMAHDGSENNVDVGISTHIRLYNSVFENNTFSSYGTLSCSAIKVTNVELTIEKSIFKSMTSIDECHSYALHAQESNVKIKNSAFAKLAGKSLNHFYGIAVTAEHRKDKLEGEQRILTIFNSSFNGMNGYNQNRAVSVMGTQNSHIENSHFLQNNAGGALLAYTKGFIRVFNSNFSGNGFGSGGQGGAILNKQATMTIDSTIFVSNQIRTDVLISAGGAIYNTGNKMSISRSSFMRNKALEGWDIFNDCDAEMKVVMTNFPDASEESLSNKLSGNFLSCETNSSLCESGWCETTPVGAKCMDNKAFAVLSMHRDDENMNQLNFEWEKSSAFSWRQDLLDKNSSTFKHIEVRYTYGDAMRLTSESFIIPNPEHLSLLRVRLPYKLSMVAYSLKLFVVNTYKNKMYRSAPLFEYTDLWQTAKDCKEGSYLKDYTNTMQQWNCSKCPVGAKCVPGITTYMDLVAMPKYWKSSKGNFYRCLQPASCNGGALNPCADPFLNNSILCSVCAEGYARGKSPGSCDRCNGVADYVVLVISCVLGILGLTFLVKTTVFKPRKIHLSDGVKKIALSYYQLAALAANLDVPWTGAFTLLFSFQASTSDVSSAFLSLDCVLSTWSTWHVFRLKNILLMSLPWVIVPIVYYGMVAVGFEKDRFISAIVLLWYILYPSLVSRSVEMLKCTDSIDGITYLEVDPNIPCFHGEHFVSVIFAVIAIIVYVIGLPVLALRTLHFQERSSIAVRQKFGILYDGYSVTFWWWEIVVVLRKIAIILINVCMQGSDQVLCSVLLVALCLCVTCLTRPFENKTLLNLEIASLTLCLLTFWAGALIRADQNKSNQFLTIFFPLVIIILNIFGFTCFAILFGTSYWREKGRVAAHVFVRTLSKCCCGCLSGEKNKQSTVMEDNSRSGRTYSIIELETPDMEYKEF